MYICIYVCTSKNTTPEKDWKFSYILGFWVPGPGGGDGCDMMRYDMICLDDRYKWVNG